MHEEIEKRDYGIGIVLGFVTILYNQPELRSHS